LTFREFHVPFNTGQPIVNIDNDPLFDFTTRGQRSATFRFALEDLTGEQLGAIHPVRNSVPTLSHDTSRSVKRTLTLNFEPATAAIFDPIRHRIRVFMVLEDGREFPLGRYMAANTSEIPTTAGNFASVALVDEMFIVAQPIQTSFSAVTASVSQSSDGLVYGSVYQAIIRLLNRYLLFNPEAEWGAEATGTTRSSVRPRGREKNVEGTDHTTTASWQSGAAGTSVLQDLAVSGDYFSPWMANDGTFRMIRAIDPTTIAPQIDFDATATVFRDSITRTSDLLNAPNRIIVTSNSGTGASVSAPVIGTYDVPNSAPHSIVNRGFVIPSIVNLQVNSRPQANVIARNIATTQHIVEKVELTTPPDPRFDSYETVRWDDELWLEIAWSMALTEGGGMRHTLQRIFQ
jgi:hypothetical protein